jgi:hypothetical protein
VRALRANPTVLVAFDPRYAISFLWYNGLIGFAVLGLVFLAVTGAETLYADLGHFGRYPIQAAWLGLALSALALNYLGQGALVLTNAKAVENPFFLMFPGWALWPGSGADNSRHGHRQPGRDCGRVLAHQTGRAAGLAPPLQRAPHLGSRGRSDLSTADQLASSFWWSCCSSPSSRAPVP